MLRLSWNKIFFLTIYFFLFPFLASAQVVPDNTLGSENSKINSLDELSTLIEGGAVRGENLFHSFQEFNVEEGTSINFANPNGITNIFSRVTGDNSSAILGELGVQGTANLFLINPNGIIFGENASININGSFLATTADNIQFADGTVFNATKPNESPLLTISFPVGLGLGSNPGAITVDGTGHTIKLSGFDPIPSTSNQTPSIKSQQNIAFIGGNIQLDGAIIETESNKIELAGTSGGYVSFEPDTWTFSYDLVKKFDDISLNSQSLVNASGDLDGSAINITGNSVSLQDSSLIILQNGASSISEGIQINSANLEVEGKPVSERTNINTNEFNNPPSNILTESLDNAKGGNIEIYTEKLSVNNGGQIVTTSFGTNSAGDLFLQVSDSIQVSNFTDSEDFSSIRSSNFNSGNSGNIDINSARLLIENGGSITTTTSGIGDAGDLNIDISEQTNISGYLPNFSNVSNLISISFSEGNAGNIILNTSELEISNGGSLTSLSTASGNAGNIEVNASEIIQIKDRIFQNPLIAGAIGSSAEIVNSTNVTEALQVPSLPSGNAGNLTITTPQLSILDGGIVAVRNTGTGDGGELFINADKITLDNTGEISASTASGQGGNITLNTNNLELLNQSQISASAGGQGDGGNITITADTILGLENSDITANAVGGNGGNITINTDLIYGFEPRSQTTPFEDITASSELGIDGTITINSPETSTDEDIIFSALKIEPRDYKKLLTGSCLDENRPGRERFNYVGGGIPESPYNYLDTPEYYSSPNPPTLEEALQNQANNTPSPDNTADNTPPIWQRGDPIISANAVEVKNGRKFLVAVNQMSEGTSICNSKADSPSPSALIKVKQIKITGNKVFSDHQLKNIIPFREGQTVTIEKLFQLQSKLTNYYVNQGYISSGAFIASQEMTNGVIEVQVIEGTLAEAEIKGLSRFQKSYFINRLPLGKPLKKNQLLLILTKLRNNPLIEDLEAELIRITPEKSVVVISVQEKNPLQTQFALSNSFSPSVGTFGGKANFNYHLAGNGDILNFGYSRTLKNGLIRYEAGYTFPINKYDGTININYNDASTNIVEEPTSALDIQADFKSYQFTVKQPIELNPNEQLFVEFKLEHIESETFIDNDFSFAFTEGLPDGQSKISALRLATEYINRGETSSFLARSQFSLGIDLLDATVTDAGIDGLFWSWLGKVQWLKQLDDDLILASNLDIQLTPDKLLPIEQISLGGANSVRGYRQNLSIGDNGVIGSVELQIPLFEFLRFDDGVVKLNPFIDGGTLWNNQDEEIESSTLFSIGAGVSLEIAEVIDARVDYGIPLIEADLPDDFDRGEKLTFSLVVTP